MLAGGERRHAHGLDRLIDPPTGGVRCDGPAVELDFPRARVLDGQHRGADVEVAADGEFKLELRDNRRGRAVGPGLGGFAGAQRQFQLLAREIVEAQDFFDRPPGAAVDPPSCLIQ